MGKPFLIGLGILAPVGAVVSVVGIIVGFLVHAWLVLWIGIGVLAAGIALGPMAMLPNVLRVPKAAAQLFGRTVIGQGIRWEDVKGQVFHVLDFTPNASVEGGKVRANSRFTPYAMLTVESPVYQEPLTMPVLHRLDFLHLWKCFQEQAVGATEELMVSYEPGRFGRSCFPHLALMIGPKGATRSSVAGNLSSEVLRATRIYCHPADV